MLGGVYFLIGLIVIGYHWKDLFADEDASPLLGLLFLWPAYLLVSCGIKIRTLIDVLKDES
jgi:hypothetical protein